MVSHSTDTPIILHTITKSTCCRLGLVVTTARGCGPPVAPLAGGSSGEYLPFDPLGFRRSRGQDKEVRDGKRTTTRGDREGEAGGLT